MSNTKILRNALLGTGLLLGIFLTLDFILDSSVWTGMKVSQSAITVEYCEFNHPERLFHQPINTYSNLIYFFYGLVIFQLALKDFNFFGIKGVNSVRNAPYLSILLAANFIYLSFGSAFFHASLTWIGQRVDMNATYGLTLSLICIGLVQVVVKKELSKQIQVALVLGMLFAHSWIPSPRLANFKCCISTRFVFGIAPARDWQLPSIPIPTKPTSPYPKLCVVGDCNSSSQPRCSQDQL